MPKTGPNSNSAPAKDRGIDRSRVGEAALPLGDNNRFPVLFAFFLVVIGLWPLGPTEAATEDDRPPVSSSTGVTSAVLDAKIAEVEAAAELTDEIKKRLIGLYRKALSNLQAADADTAAAEAFQQAIRSAPLQVLALEKELDSTDVTDPLESLPVEPSTPLREVERLLRQGQADLAAADARRAELEKRLTREQTRPEAISLRLAEARLARKEAGAALEVTPGTDEETALTQAVRWVLETRSAALDAEIKMLEQELLSRPMRLDLLGARRDAEIRGIARIETRVKVLGELVNRKRQLEAEQSRIAAEAKQREAAGLDPLLGRLADENAALGDELSAAAAGLDAMDRQQAEAEQLAGRIAADYQDIETTVETSGPTRGLGQLLARHRKKLPDSEFYARRARDRDQQIAEIAERRLRYREAAREIADLDQSVAVLAVEIRSDKRPQLEEQLRGLVGQRQVLLQKALEADEFYLRKLRALDDAERKLLGAVQRFNVFLDEHLLWLRSSDPTGLDDLVQLPGELKRLFSPAIWSELGRLFYDQAISAPLYWLGLLVVALLLWKHRALIANLEGIDKRLGKPTSDSFSHSLQALALTLLAAAPWPLLLATAGWQLQMAEQGSDLSHAVGWSLQRVALQLYVLGALYLMAVPRGLAAAHFRWPESSLQLLRTELIRLIWIFVPAVLIVRLAVDLNPAETGGTIARLGFVVGYAAMSLYLYRVFHPKRGVLAQLRLRHQKSLLLRSDRIWFPLLVAYPSGLILLALSGYMYTAAALSYKFQYTLWLILGLILAHALAVRWLTVVRRRLIYESAMERRQTEAELAEMEAEGAGSGSEADTAWQYDEPEADVESLSDESLELVKFALIAAGLVGLYLIWYSVLPALQIFQEINVWYHTVTVDGEARRLPITLADLGLAVIYAVAVAVLAKRLPAVLEIILLQRFDMASGSRYTITTLVSYAIIAAGILLIFNTIGAQWSQLQWLVAALGVGIGFGLQEIVANFISGLIILFERPIRIGDVVTIGETDGVVTKIRIRATTIRNWDRKELLVPNKEFITGRLLNWSLSDKTTRILLSVGIAYGSNVPEAMRLLEEAAGENEDVLAEPQPSVIFEAFGDNALTLVLRCFTDAVDSRLLIMSALNEAINDKFNRAGIVIAFPQRDLHLHAGEPVRVSIEKT